MDISKSDIISIVNLISATKRNKLYHILLWESVKTGQNTTFGYLFSYRVPETWFLEISPWAVSLWFCHFKVLFFQLFIHCTGEFKLEGDRKCILSLTTIYSI